MPNTFGTASRQVKLIDPRHARRYRVRFQRDAIPQLDLANSLYVPRGYKPARGWIVLTRKDYDTVRGYGRSFQLKIDQFDPKAPGLTFNNLAIVQAQCVTTGVSGDENALYLIELTDSRGILVNEWFSYPTNSYYNVLSPAYPTLYHSASLNAGSPWTWNTLAQNLWNQMTNFLGTYPGLPSTPTGTPANWNLPGVSAWEALCRVLTHIGMTVSCDLTAPSPYGIVSLGAADATFDALVTRYTNRIEDDREWIDIGSGRIPGTVIVYFRRVNQLYGTEETIRRDTLQWATGSVYALATSAPAAFSGALGVHGIYDDFPVRYDVNGVPLAADATIASIIATERVTQYYNSIYSGTLGYLNRTYKGILPFYAGGQIDSVCWKQTLSDKREGWTTQIMRGET